jgi:nicotinamide phosphoribosyltransferase
MVHSLVHSLLQGLRACESIFGADTNQKGYKVLRGVGVIQGDGINISTLADILEAVLAAGYSAENVSFGMGGGLLQKVNRDTMSFATKLSHVVFQDGRAADVMKLPKTDAGKFSLPGEGEGQGRGVLLYSNISTLLDTCYGMKNALVFLQYFFLGEGEGVK